MSATLPKQWLDIATEDLTVAHLVFEEEHLAHTCFLSQQCIEKSLKAYLISKANTYPRTHNLVILLNQCEMLEPTFSQFRAECITIDQYYVPTRYPDAIPGGLPTGSPTEQQARKAITAAEIILQFVTAQLA
jgi:HEPN domain-containing protein